MFAYGFEQKPQMLWQSRKKSISDTLGLVRLVMCSLCRTEGEEIL